MGTSLSGLTPATTFDGLLKTSDNEPLDGTLKTISDGSGVDSVLQLSNSALQVNGEATIVSDTGTFLNFNDTINPTQEFTIKKAFSSLAMFDVGTSATKIRLFDDYLRIGVGGATTRLSLSNDGNLGLGIGNSTAAATTHIKGSGATSATTSLLVQNSAGAQLLKVDDGRNLYLGDSSNYIHRGSVFQGNYSAVGDWNFGSALDLGARLGIKGSGNDNTTTSLLVQNSDGTDIINVSDNGIIGLNPTDNGAKWELNAANNYILSNVYAHYYDTAGTINFRNSNVLMGLGTSAAPNTRLLIKGSGATSATTALLVQNSAGTDLLKVEDGGTVRSNGIKGIIYPNNHLSLGSNAEFLGFNSITAPKIGVNIVVPSGVQAAIKGTGNDATTTALLVQNSDGTDMLKVTDDGATTIQSNFGVSGGDVAVFQNSADPTNQFKINKRDDSTNIWYTGTTNTEIEYRDTIHFRFNLGGVTQMQLRNSGNLGLGVGSANASARMHIKGSGATSATTALLVENSSGTDLLKIEDGGDLKIDNGVSNDLKVKISPIANKYLELDRQGRQVRIYSGATGNAGIFMTQQDKFSIGVNDTPLLLLDENSNVKIGSGITSADTSAKLQVDSTTQGFLPPRMTDSERDAITSPAAGLMVYDTSNNQMNYWNGSSWIAF